MNSFDNYVKELQEPARLRVSEIINMADEVLIGAEKVIVYEMPTYRLKGKNVFSCCRLQQACWDLSWPRGYKGVFTSTC